MNTTKNLFKDYIVLIKDYFKNCNAFDQKRYLIVYKILYKSFINEDYLKLLQIISSAPDQACARQIVENYYAYLKSFNLGFSIIDYNQYGWRIDQVSTLTMNEIDISTIEGSVKIKTVRTPNNYFISGISLNFAFKGEFSGVSFLPFETSKEIYLNLEDSQLNMLRYALSYLKKCPKSHLLNEVEKYISLINLRIALNVKQDYFVPKRNSTESVKGEQMQLF